MWIINYVFKGKMKNAYNEDSDYSVFNDYEESIMFDEDDPDFKSNDNLEFSCSYLYKNKKNGK